MYEHQSKSINSMKYISHPNKYTYLKNAINSCGRIQLKPH